MTRRLAPLLALLLAGPAHAQTGASVSVPQVSAPGRAQVGADQAPGAPPLSGRRGRSDLASAPAQVGDTRLTAEAGPELSTRAEGRAVGVSAVGGRDRCETAPIAQQPAACRHPIEARAGEYRKPGAAPVTPEARLLILATPQPPATMDEAARRLATPAGVDALAGSAASTLAGAIDPGRGEAAVPAPAAAAAGAGVPTAAVIGPH